MASIGGYRSPVDLGLGRVPTTADADLFDEMTDVYNAIHLLNQYLDQLRIVAEGGGGSGQLPSDSMPFNRFYVATALQTITAGEAVSPSAITGQNGIVKGVLGNDFASTAPNSNFTGIALIDAAVGEDVRVGIGPAILEFPGAVTSQLIWAYPQRNTGGALTFAGGLYVGSPGAAILGGSLAYPMPVGTCPRNGFVLIGQYLSR